MRKVWVRIFADDNDASMPIMEAVGLYAKKGDRHLVHYVDTSLGEGLRVRTLLQWKGQVLSVHRTGDIEERRRFALGEEVHTLYKTPFGNIPFSYRTEALTLTIAADTLSIALAYRDTCKAGGTLRRLRLEIVPWNAQKSPA